MRSMVEYFTLARVCVQYPLTLKDFSSAYNNQAVQEIKIGLGLRSPALADRALRFTSPRPASLFASLETRPACVPICNISASYGWAQTPLYSIHILEVLRVSFILLLSAYVRGHNAFYVHRK
jgi:hypothetical protein